MQHIRLIIFFYLLHAHDGMSLPTDFSNTKLGFNDSKWYRELDLIHGSSRRFKPNDIENPVFLLDRLSAADGSRSLPYCRRSASCQTLNYTTCFGAKLPYTKTTLELVPRLETQEQIMVRFVVTIQVESEQHDASAPSMPSVQNDVICSEIKSFYGVNLKCSKQLINPPTISEGYFPNAISYSKMRKRVRAFKEEGKNICDEPRSVRPSVITEDLYHFAVWKGLVHLPRCWAVIQPFLCSLYMPKCENDQVDLPSQEMCKVLLGPCRILTTENAWPMALRCHNTTDFPSGCKNDVRELKFNTTGRCQEPMVPTDSPSSYYDGMEGCGVQCDNPMFTPDERYQIHRLVAWAATTCFLFNLFTVVTFMIDWKSSSKYPALVIFYINLCFLIVCLGWLAQFLPGGREDIVCRKDRTLRVGEPNSLTRLSQWPLIIPLPRVVWVLFCSADQHGIAGRGKCPRSKPIFRRMQHIRLIIFFYLLHAHDGMSLPTDFSNTKLGFNDSKWYRELDLIHGSSRRFKPNDIENPVFLLDRLSAADGSRSLPYCRRSASCQTLNYTTCFGAKLPYTKTTLELVPRLETQEQIMVRFVVTIQVESEQHDASAPSMPSVQNDVICSEIKSFYGVNLKCSKQLINPPTISEGYFPNAISYSKMRKRVRAFKEEGKNICDEPRSVRPSVITEDLYHFAVWKGLVHLPRCWAVIQPFLCSLYMPKCENDQVDLPSQEMCKVLLGPCRILTTENAWPMALRCHNTTDFPSGCKNDVRELKFNTTGRCQEPMVPTDSPSSYYDGMEGCGVQCDNPMFTPDERYQIHRLVAWAATICFLFNLFTVASRDQL
ncbi:hypothetical protein J6590_052374 [Homalodisca vitripennis]|nr:hypothetical protein J6590_052374 [Homalodisca vitripennis]